MEERKTCASAVHQMTIDLSKVPLRDLRREPKRREDAQTERERKAHMKRAISAGYPCALCGECARCTEDDLL